MTREIRYLDEAREDLRAEVSWYREHRGVHVAECFLDEISEAVELLAELPDAGPVSALDSRVRIRNLRRIRHTIVYQVRPATIFILAIAHMRRRPGYWLDRVT